jgi:hypothetical protein
VRLVALASAVTVGLLILPSTGFAATTIGQVGDPTGGQCGAPQTVTNQIAPVGPDYRVPAGGGVITSWRHMASADSVETVAKLKILSEGPPATVRDYTTLAESEIQTIRPSELNEFPARMVVNGGELIGLTVKTFKSSGLTPCQFGTTPGTTMTVRYATSDPPPSTTTQYFPRGGYADVSATLEQDADGDGYGDETQDQCPANPAAHDGCQPTVPDLPGPAPDNSFQLGLLQRLPAGWALLTLDVPGPGAVKARATASVPRAAAKRKRITVARATAKPTAAMTVVLILRPTKKARRVLARRNRLRARVAITFTPTGGTANTRTRSLILRR